MLPRSIQNMEYIIGNCRLYICYQDSGAWGTSGAANTNALRVLAIDTYNGDMGTMRKALIVLNRK
jgi:hypothetical protein